MTRTALALTVLTLLTGAVPGKARADRATAGRYYQSGYEHFVRGRYAKAIADLRRAMRELPQAKRYARTRNSLRYYVGICLCRLGRLPQAVATLEAYLEGPGRKDRRSRARKMLQETRRRMGRRGPDRSSAAGRKAPAGKGGGRRKATVAGGAPGKKPGPAGREPRTTKPGATSAPAVVGGRAATRTGAMVAPGPVKPSRSRAPGADPRKKVGAVPSHPKPAGRAVRGSLRTAGSTGRRVALAPVRRPSTRESPALRPAPPRRSRVLGVLSWTAVAAGVAAIATGGVLGALANRSESDRDQAYTHYKGQTNPDVEHVLEPHTAASSRATAANVLFVTGGVLAAAGTVLVVVNHRTRRRSIRSKVTAGVGPGSLFVVGSF